MFKQGIGRGIIIGDPGHYLTQYWHSKSSRNFYGPYSNPKFDEPLDKALVTYDPEGQGGPLQRGSQGDGGGRSLGPHSCE